MKVAAAVLLCSLFIPIPAQDTALPLPAGPAQNPGDTLVVIGTGDIMLGTDYPSRTYLPPGGDCSPLLRPVLDVLRSGDVLFGNLEGVFCSEGGTPKYCKDTTNCFVFRMPDHFVNCLVEAGYDVVSVANNHVNDFGPHGRTTTAEVLTKAGIAFAGFTTHPWTVFQKEGVTYGFAAFSPHTGTMDLKNYGEAARITRMLDSIADVVIISFHGGAEGREHQHVVRGDEEYLGYNRGNTYQFAHTVVDAGADVVFGHGPHVTRAMELYRERLICYSLGNFCTYRRFNLSGPNGLAPIVKVRMDRRGNFISAEVIPVYQPGEGGPRIDPAQRVIRSLQELTAADFPDRLLSISADGTVLPPFGLARLEVPGVGSPEEGPGADTWGWAPERLEMIWTHFLGETVPAGEPGSCRRNRVERTGTPMLVKEGRDTFLIQDFDHRMKKLDASTGALVWEYASADTAGRTRAVSYITGRELPGDQEAETGPGIVPGIIKMKTGEPALLIPRPAAGALYTDSTGAERALKNESRLEEMNPALKEVISRQAGTFACVPLITEKRLVVCNEDGIWLYAYDRNCNVELLDRLPVPVNADPVLVGGKLYVASLNGYLYCLGDKD
ncbi:MAG TPA: CapA family protein [Bacteroides sp.]|nr:CapA family protein [Bacteroides sp.]